jgi:hypothetical protein
VGLRHIPFVCLFVCNFISFNYASSAAAFSHAVTRTAIMRILVLGDRFGEERASGQSVLWCRNSKTQELY